jgi:hypothetical protein
VRQIFGKSGVQNRRSFLDTIETGNEASI